MSRIPASLTFLFSNPRVDKNNHNMIKFAALLSLLGLSPLASAKTPTITLPWGVYEGHQLAEDDKVTLPT